MDGAQTQALYVQERRRRLAAERTLERTRSELSRAHSALVANADRLSRRYLSERETNLRLTDRQAVVLQERKEAAERADRARRRLWHALEAMRDGFALFDANFRLVAANSVYLGLFDVGSELGPGASLEELLALAADEGAFDLSDTDPDDWIEGEVARLRSDPIPPQMMTTFDGRSIRFQERKAPDGDIVCLAVDISEIEARKQSLAAARDAAEEAARAKSEFLARMSHEMRTPMNGILGLAEMLAAKDMDAESREIARTIKDSSEALLTIVNDTLDVSRLEADRVDLRHAEFDLEELLLDCLRLLSATRTDGSVVIAFGYPFNAPTRFAGDEGRIRQIVMNLLGNALKFTDEGTVSIRAKVTDLSDDQAQVALRFQDTGPGIPEQDRDRIFGAFNQVDDGRPQKEGTGLGLTISRGLAERMGGTISVVDGTGVGACFELVLPLQPIQRPAHGTPLPARVFVPEGGPQLAIIADLLVKAGTTVLRRDPNRAEVGLATPAELHDPDLDWSDPALGRLPFVLLDALPNGRNPTHAHIAARLAPICRNAELASALVGGAVGPLVDTEPADAPPSPPEPEPARPIRLLIADDNATNRFLLEKMLAGEGFEIRLVTNGAEAYAAYVSERPDVVLLDISMPVMDGFEAAARMRAHDLAEDQDHIPTIALTAHTGDEIASRLDEAGFDAHQTKPVRKPELLAAIAKALGRAHTDQGHAS